MMPEGHFLTAGGARRCLCELCTLHCTCTLSFSLAAAARAAEKYGTKQDNTVTVSTTPGKLTPGTDALRKMRSKHGSRSVYEKFTNLQSVSKEIELVAREMTKGMLGRKQLIDLLMSDEQFQMKSYNDAELDLIWRMATEMMRGEL